MSRHRHRRWATLVALTAVLITSCTPTGNQAGPDTTKVATEPLDLFAVDVPPLPAIDAAAAQAGEPLYQQYCAACHGADLSGEENWMIRKPDGSYPAPPHDESGHTWHHSDELLLEIIGDGLDFADSRMPTFGDQLSDDQIVSIVEYLKSKWGPEQRAFQWQITWQELQRDS